MANISGKNVGQIGFGMMSFGRAETPHDQVFETLQAALKQGANFWNGSEFYGPPNANSLHLAHDFFAKYPEAADKIVLSIKGGMAPGKRIPDGSPENTRRCIEECLRVLDGKKKIDVWEHARVDPNVPIEKSVQAIEEYVQKGHVGGISLSEASANSIRRAAKVVKVQFVEVEFGLGAPDILHNGVFDACGELGIPIVAYGVLGHGLLTNQFKELKDVPENDFRRMLPSFSPENFAKNRELSEKVQEIADAKGCSLGQIAISWVVGHGKRPGAPPIIPLPGATRAARVEENQKVVELSEKEMTDLDALVASMPRAGERYPEPINQYCFGDSPPLE